MNEVYALLFSVLMFLCLSFIANILLPKYKIVYLVTGLIVYLLLSIIILFPFSDFVISFLNRNGVKTYYSHNDMVLIFEIVSVCIIVWVINSAKIILKYGKLRRT